MTPFNRKIIELNRKLQSIHLLDANVTFYFLYECAVLCVSEINKGENFKMNKLQKIEKINKEKNKLTYKKIESQLDLLVKGQEVNQKELRLGFIGLAKQNQELFELKKKLTQQLETVVEELNQLKTERQERNMGKSKTFPQTSEIYQALIGATEADNVRYTGYTAARLRIALCLLAITGIRVNELLPLKVHQLKTLLTEGWIAIDRSKRGPASHRAYLSKQGKQILKSRQKDFDLLYLLKEDKSYIFTSQLDHNKHIRREQITKDINKIMALVSKNLPDQPNLKSHSFRTSFITQLWKDTNDIEFVRQVIGHSKLDTTSSYVQDLSEKERRERIVEI
jgi:integrase